MPSPAREPIEFGEVIAEREYRVGRRKILLQIGTPHQASWKTDFYCPFRLVHGGRIDLHRTYGIDAIQALMLSFDIIKVLLARISPKISWAGAEAPGDVGIYRRLSSGLGMEFDRDVERYVDEAVLERSRELERLSKAKRKKPRA